MELKDFSERAEHVRYTPPQAVTRVTCSYKTYCTLWWWKVELSTLQRVHCQDTIMLLLGLSNSQITFILYLRYGQVTVSLQLGCAQVIIRFWLGYGYLTIRLRLNFCNSLNITHVLIKKIYLILINSSEILILLLTFQLIIEFRFDSRVIGFKFDIISLKIKKFHSGFQYEKINSYVYNSDFYTYISILYH